ncbi:MAG: hypothetical protein QW321_02065, partial [Candidatus Aenigmatarchaeota archaeon]
IIVEVVSFLKMIGKSLEAIIPGAMVGSTFLIKIRAGGIREEIRKLVEEAAENMKNSSPQELLASSSSNFFIAYENITKIEIIAGSFWRSTLIRIFVDEKRYYEYKLVNRFLSTGISRELLNKYVNIIRSVLGDRLIVRPTSQIKVDNIEVKLIIYGIILISLSIPAFIFLFLGNSSFVGNIISLETVYAPLILLLSLIIPIVLLLGGFVFIIKGLITDKNRIN